VVLDRRPAPASWSGIGVECSAKDACRHIQIDPARPPGHGSMNRAGDSNTNVFGPVDPVGRLCVGLCGIHLIELFIIALLEIDDVTLARAADLDHREAVGGSIGKCHQAVQKAWRRNGQANSRFLVR